MHVVKTLPILSCIFSRLIAGWLVVVCCPPSVTFVFMWYGERCGASLCRENIYEMLVWMSCLLYSILWHMGCHYSMPLTMSTHILLKLRCELCSVNMLCDMCRVMSCMCVSEERLIWYLHVNVDMTPRQHFHRRPHSFPCKYSSHFQYLVIKPMVCRGI